MSEQRAETDTSNPFVARMERCASWVNERWRRTEQDELAFPGIAKEALESTPVDQFSIESLVRWAIDTDRLPMTGGDDTFGEPPLTVAIGPGFKIDVLFWSE